MNGADKVRAGEGEMMNGAEKLRAGEENSTLMNPLKSCCEEEGLTNSCGSVDDNGENKYTLCENPELSFFWDNLHPSQNGWHAIYTLMQSSLGQLIDKN
ncbi:hypothetical protein RYX36_020033 [Vicia faba]